MRLGDVFLLRATGERVVLLGLTGDGSTLVVGNPDRGRFEVHEDEVEGVHVRDGCACH